MAYSASQTSSSKSGIGGDVSNQSGSVFNIGGVPAGFFDTAAPAGLISRNELILGGIAAAVVVALIIFRR